jgi:UDP-N-acetylglucosamine--N-acetylmuramyl-(pentapeptide) pyrophosphoryl-undecaprenol N-acetylglucosamine transferase
MIRVVIAGGGTGGHTSPGLAVAAVLRARGADCIWIGSRDGIEARCVPDAQIRYYAIPTGKLRRYWSWRNLSDLAIGVPSGLVRAFSLLRSLDPDIVFATGGFVALPVVLAAAVRRLPVVIHEQTAVPGLANRIAARFASVVALTYAEGSAGLPARRCVLVGNPLRPELRGGSRERAAARFGLDPAEPLVYVTGGAQGAHRINRVVGEALPGLLELAQIVHQCGDNPHTADHAWLLARRAELPAHHAARFHPVPYVGSELADIYAAAHLVIGRAGAGTVNECCQLGLPAVYIPLPGASGDEQTVNARLVESVGGCVILPQADLTADRLLATVGGLLKDPGELSRMGARARARGISDAAERLADLIAETAHGERPSRSDRNGHSAQRGTIRS